MGLRRSVDLSADADGGSALRARAAVALMVASGYAGLGYQVVWTQQCASWLGHEAAAVLAVVAAFFGGLASGALLFGQRVAASVRPARWYAGCEFTVAGWSLLVTLAMPTWSAWMLRATGVQPAPAWQWGVAFVGTFLFLLPATAAMGATLPAMERATARLHAGRTSIAWLYAANTFGAVAGVLGAAFWLIPTFGLARTSAVSSFTNVLCGVAALFVFPARVDSAPAAVESAQPVDTAARRRALVRLAWTGFLGIGFEVLVVRVLGQVTEDTVYTFALLLAVYLVGSAAGAAGYHRWLSAHRSGTAPGDFLVGTLAAACLSGTAFLLVADRMKTRGVQLLGPGLPAALAVEGLLALAAFGPSTVVMGALFSHLSDRARIAGGSFGAAVGVNTLGAAVAPALFGVVAVPLVGPKWSLLLIGCGYLALTRLRVWRKPLVGGAAGGAVVLAVVLVVFLALFAPPLAFVDVPAGGRLVRYTDGVMAAVSVVEDAEGVARLRINNRQQEGSSATFRFDARQAWLPLLLHPSPRRALFLGLGTGVTAAAAAEDPRLQVDAVELLPEVIEASTAFQRPPVDTAAAARLHIIAADARRFVRASGARYDVIVSDNFHPARSGSGTLYTVEHFRAVRDRLSVGGVFCQWLPLHQLDLETLRSIVRSFLNAYPVAWAMLANNSLETPVVGLVGRAAGARFDPVAMQSRTAAAVASTSRIGLDDEMAVLGSFVAAEPALRNFAGDARANTDDVPMVAYRAPRMTYAPESSPEERLFALLDRLSIAPEQLIAGAPSDLRARQRLAAYWAARDQFLRSGRDVRRSARVDDMLAQVREPLLSVLRLSPDFRPAYDPLLAMARSLAHSDPDGARALLTELVRLQPARAEATTALASLTVRGPWDAAAPSP